MSVHISGTLNTLTSDCHRINNLHAFQFWKTCGIVNKYSFPGTIIAAYFQMKQKLLHFQHSDAHCFKFCNIKCIYPMWMSCRKRARPNLQKVNPHHKRRKTCYMSTDLLKHGFRVTVSWQWQKVSEFSTLSFHAGVVGDRLSGNCVLPPGLTDYLRNFVPELLQELSL